MIFAACRERMSCSSNATILHLSTFTPVTTVFDLCTIARLFAEALFHHSPGQYVLAVVAELWPRLSDQPEPPTTLAESDDG